MTKKILYSIMLMLLPLCLDAIETQEINLVGDGQPGARLYQDAFGNLVLEDTSSTSTTLTQLRTAIGDHGALTGLSDDDHPAYLNASRHLATHDSFFNDVLTITPDGNGNSTLGGHVGDASIHLNRQQAETINGAWTFVGTLAAQSGALMLGTDGAAADPAVIFDEQATLSFNSAAEHFRLSETLDLDNLSLSGTINGDPAADLLFPDQPASINGEWNFYGGLRSETTTLLGSGTVRLLAINASGGPIARGTPVLPVTLIGRDVAVSTYSGAPGEELLGFAATDAAPGGTVPVSLLGVSDALTTGTITAGQSLKLDGNRLAPASSGDKATGVALETSSGGGVIAVWVKH